MHKACSDLDLVSYYHCCDKTDSDPFLSESCADGIFTLQYHLWFEAMPDASLSQQECSIETYVTNKVSLDLNVDGAELLLH